MSLQETCFCLKQNNNKKVFICCCFSHFQVVSRLCFRRDYVSVTNMFRSGLLVVDSFVGLRNLLGSVSPQLSGRPTLIWPPSVSLFFFILFSLSLCLPPLPSSQIMIFPKCSIWSFGFILWGEENKSLCFKGHFIGSDLNRVWIEVNLRKFNSVLMLFMICSLSIIPSNFFGCFFFLSVSLSPFVCVCFVFSSPVFKSCSCMGCC